MTRPRLQSLFSLVRLRAFELFFAGVFLAWNPVPVESANLTKLPDSVANLDKDDPGLEKIEWQVRDIYTRYIRTGQLPKTFRLTADTQPYASPIKIAGDSIRLIIEFGHEINAGDSIALIQAGARVELKTANLVQAWVPLRRLNNIASVDGVGWVRLPHVGYNDETTSEIMTQGILFVMPEYCHDEGFTGQGVKVAILDLGFSGYHSLLGSELPSSVDVKSFRSDGQFYSGVHGTACAEIVHDLAPDASILLAAFETGVEFMVAVDTFLARGIDVVSNSTSSMVGPIDGTSAISQKVNEAAEKGIVWCSSAGNGAKKHWTGFFFDSDDDQWHNFSGEGETNTIEATYGDNINIYLDWYDWPTSDQNFDLYLYDDPVDSILAKSLGAQPGNKPPTERIIDFVAPYTGKYHIAIMHTSGPESARLHLRLTNSSPDLQYNVPSRSVRIPSDASGAFCVGATWWLTPSIIEAYSSRGPTEDGRIKPDIVGPDGVSTASYDPGYFYGTSASTPHAAGVAALVLSATPCWDQEKVTNFMRDWAMDEGDSGPDNTFGWGFLRARCATNHPPSIEPVNNVTIQENGSYELLISALDQDGDPIVLELEDPPRNTNLIDYGNGTGLFTFRPDFSQEGIYSIRIRASDCTLSTTLTFSVSIINANKAPSITGPTTVAVKEAQTTTIHFTTSDPDGDPVSVSVIDNPTNSTLSQTGSFSWKFAFSPDYDQAGSYSVLFIVSDGSLADSLKTLITVDNVNRRPSLAGPTSAELREGETLTLRYTASDPDGETLTLSVTDAPENSVITKMGTNVWNFTFIPAYDQAGVYLVSFKISDGDMSYSVETRITVTNKNRTPTITGPFTASVDEGESVILDLSVGDPDGDQIILVMIGSPPNSNLAKTGSSSWQFSLDANYGSAGIYSILFIASDGSLADTLITQLTVIQTNRAPIISGPSSVTVKEGESTSFVITASDPDGDTLSLSVVDSPPNSTLTQQSLTTWEFEFSPTYAQAGSYEIIFVVSDGSLADSLKTSVTVENVNRRPSLTGPPSAELREGETLALRYTASDPDGETLTLSATDSPENSVITTMGTNVWDFTFIPTYDQAGIYLILFKVSDNDLTDSLETQITVINKNRTPQIPTPGDLTTSEGSIVETTINASDPDGDSLSLWPMILPANSTFEDQGDGSGVFIFEPDYTQAGTYSITIYVADYEDTSTIIFYVDVENVNQKPTRFSLLSPGVGESLRDTTVELLWHSSSDPDIDEEVSYWVYVDDQSGETDSTFSGNDTALTVSNLTELGSYSWRVIARDTTGGETENIGGLRSFSVGDLTPPQLFFGLIFNSVIPYSGDFVVKPSEDLKSYVSAVVQLDTLIDSISLDHRIASSDGEIFTARYDFPGDGLGSIVLRGVDLSDNETLDTIPLSSYQIDHGASIIGSSFDRTLRLNRPRERNARQALLVSYLPDNIPPFENPDWTALSPPCRFVSSDNQASEPVEIRVSTAELNRDYESILVFQLESTGWKPLSTQKTANGSDYFAWAESLGTFIAAGGGHQEEISTTVNPARFNLRQNTPNPFNSTTTIAFDMAADGGSHFGVVTVDVYNILGQKVKTLRADILGPGEHSVTWDGSNGANRPMPSGIYFARLTAGRETATIKMVLMK